MARSHLVASLFLAMAFSGCVLGEGEYADCSRFDPGPAMYTYRYDGSDVAVAGGTYGWALRVTNPYDRPMSIEMTPQGNLSVRYGTVEDLAWNVFESDLQRHYGYSYPLGHNESALWLFEATVPADATGTLEVGHTLAVRMYDYLEDGGSAWVPDSGFCSVERDFGDAWDLQVERDRPAVSAGDKVRTRTLGLWTNGTSFYTNIQELDDDPAFPAGYDRTGFGGDPLPVYVYDQDRREQPTGNRDRCWITTITGYNDLLKTQHETGTGVRFLLPQEAYTFDGAEDHFLYGEALVFMNTVVAHEGTTTQDEDRPDPTGPCFDARNTCRKETFLSEPCMRYVPPPGDLPPAER